MVTTIAISGGSGAGKSTATQNLYDMIKDAGYETHMIWSPTRGIAKRYSIPLTNESTFDQQLILYFLYDFKIGTGIFEMEDLVEVILVDRTIIDTLAYMSLTPMTAEQYKEYVILKDIALVKLKKLDYVFLFKQPASIVEDGIRVNDQPRHTEAVKRMNWLYKTAGVRYEVVDVAERYGGYDKRTEYLFDRSMEIIEKEVKKV